MTTRVQKAIDIFLDAINNGTLAKGYCRACAVGNLVANGMGINILSDFFKGPLRANPGNHYWKMAFMTTFGRQQVNQNHFNDTKVLECVNATDFSIFELMKIENAFELATKIDLMHYSKTDPHTVRADQIKGLEAVVKVMLEFENEVDDVKEVFTKRAELIPV